MATKEDMTYNNSGFENLTFGHLPSYTDELSTGAPGRAASSTDAQSTGSLGGGAPYDVQSTGIPHRRTPYIDAPSTGTPYRSAPYDVPSVGAPYGSAPYSGQVHPNVSTSQHPAFIMDEQSVRLYTLLPDHRCLAWFACICCFLPLGVFAVVRAHKSRSALIRGDIESAKLNSADARLFSLISIVIGVFIFMVMVAVTIVVQDRQSFYVDCNCRT